MSYRPSTAYFLRPFWQSKYNHIHRLSYFIYEITFKRVNFSSNPIQSCFNIVLKVEWEIHSVALKCFWRKPVIKNAETHYCIAVEWDLTLLSTFSASFLCASLHAIMHYALLRDMRAHVRKGLIVSAMFPRKLMSSSLP